MLINAAGALKRVSDLEVRQLLDPAAVVATIERAFKADYASFVFPERQHIDAGDTIFLSMPCYNWNTGNLGVKFVTVRKEASAAQPTVQASYLLFDPHSAEPRLWLEANWLTDVRTAATSFVATKFLARGDACVLGIFGTGRQARAHIEVFARLRKFERILVCGSTPQCTGKFIDELPKDLAINAEAAVATQCAAEADIVCTCTTAPEPLFSGSQLRPGTHLNLVGAFQPESREVDSVTISHARVVVDTYAGALREAGDVLIPLREGKITRDTIAELHQVVSGTKPARQNDQEITVFKSVGCALEDLAVAEFIAAKLGHAPA
jgi:alanine dehydrogenase